MQFIAWHPLFNFPLPAGHRFPMIKYELLHDQLLYEGVVKESAFFVPEMLEEKYLIPVHKEEYVRRLLTLQLSRQEIRRIGFPLSQKLVERELRIARGTITAATIAVQNKIGFNIAGGTHHAGSDWGEGFCLLNDQAIAARYLLDHTSVNQILIIDLDVHQGNGTAEIFQNEKKVFTFSMHGRNNFPFHKEKSNLDIGLEDNTTGDQYLTCLKKNLDFLFKTLQPDFVFFLAGAD
ncbi:MAG: histone deacetylase family protein, partial [Chitinophagaceae bacterium]